MRKYIFFLIFVFIIIDLYSQSSYRYIGGTNDGHNIHIIKNINLGNIGMVSAYRYSGGFDDGYEFELLSNLDLSIIGQASSFRYAGGSDDGYENYAIDNVDLSLITLTLKLNLKVFLQGAYK